MYEHYGANVKTEYTIAAEHSMPTNIETNQACSKNASPFINYCGYDGAFETLSHISSKAPLNAPGEMNPDNLFFYKQKSVKGMASTGYAYVPEACQAEVNDCHIHVAIHGCRQNVVDINM